MKVKELKRICNKCGREWFIPKRDAFKKAPSRARMASYRMMAAGSSASLFSVRRTSDQMRLANAQAKGDRVTALSSCPDCNSTDFRQVQA